MSIRVQIAHQTPGRVRLQVPERRGDNAFFDEVSRRITESGLVHSVRVNPVTGSIVLEFDGQPEQQLAKLGAAMPFEIEMAPAGQAQRAALPEPARPFKLVSDREINPMLMASTLFAAVGVVQAIRGQLLVPALTAFWYAANAFRMAETPKEGAAHD